MPKPFRQLTIQQFADELSRFNFTRKVTQVHMHHTFIPRKTHYTGLATIEGMWKFHTQNNGWSDIAQHVSIAPDGTIWTGRDWNKTPASATGFSTGAFMFETIGNFDVGQEQLTGPQRKAVIEVIARVQLKCRLPLESLHFHREFTDQKTCPGNGVRKADILNEVRARRAEIEAGTRELVFAGVEDEEAAGSFSRSASFFGGDGAGSAGEARPFDERDLERDDGDEGEIDCGAVAQDERSVEVAGELAGAGSGEPVASVEPETRGTGRRRALCVGINAYPGNLRLSGCVADARLWARRLAEVGFQVQTMLDAQATEANLTAALQRLVRESRPGDVVVFQYAGHGTHFRDVGGDESDAQDEALVPVDCNDGRFLLDDEQFAIFGALPDGVAFTCIYDCCHSGSMSRAALTALAATPAEPATPRFMDPTPEMWEEYRRRKASRGTRSLRTAESLKTVAFSACRDDEVALERGGQGVFTKHVSALVRDAVRRGLSNEAFQRLILLRFPEPSQHPALDCATRSRRLPFLRPVAGRGAEPVEEPVEAGADTTSAADIIDLPIEAWQRFTSNLSEAQREELARLIGAEG